MTFLIVRSAVFSMHVCGALSTEILIRSLLLSNTVSVFWVNLLPDAVPVESSEFLRIVDVRARRKDYAYSAVPHTSCSYIAWRRAAPLAYLTYLAAALQQRGGALLIA